MHPAGPESPRPRIVLPRLLAVAATLIALVLTTLFTAPDRTSAAPNDKIAVSNGALSLEEGERATVGDTLMFTADWDATRADPKPGDEFAIGLPEQLGFAEAVPIALDDDEATEWGGCLTDPEASRIVCTLGEAVGERAADVRGSLEFAVVAVAAVESDELPFDVQGTGTPVALPGGGIDPAAPASEESGQLKKSAKWIGPLGVAPRWTIEIPGSLLVGLDEAIVEEFWSLYTEPCLLTDDLRFESVRGERTTDLTPNADLRYHGEWPVDDPENWAGAEHKPHFQWEYTIGEDEGLTADVRSRLAWDAMMFLHGEGGGSQGLELTNPGTLTLTPPSGGFDSADLYRVSYTTCINTPGANYGNPFFASVSRLQHTGELSNQSWAYQRDSWVSVVTLQGELVESSENRNGVAWTYGQGTIVGEPRGERARKDLPADAPPEGTTVRVGLGAGQELCEVDGKPTLPGFRVEEIVDGQRRVVGDDELTYAVTRKAADRFDLRIESVEGSSFKWERRAASIEVSYQTCASAAAPPTGGARLSSDVETDGYFFSDAAEKLRASAEVTVPDRVDEKTAAINTKPVKIQGEQLLPQTSIGWQVRVPGERLADLDGPLEFTDVVQGPHRVCGTGGDPASRLGLTIEARDQLADGGLQTVDLTGTATVELDTGSWSLSIPPPTLPLPGGGEATGFSRDYQYVIGYTTCTASGRMDDRGTTYATTADIHGKEYRAEATQQNRAGKGSGTGIVPMSFRVALAVEGATNFIPKGATATVHAREIDPDGVEAVAYDLEVPLDGSPVSGKNRRGTNWKMELSDPVFPDLPGLEFDTPAFDETSQVEVSEDGQAAVAPLVDGQDVSVTLRNTAMDGTIEVRKLLEGSAADRVADDEFEVTAAIDTSALGKGFPKLEDRSLTIGVDDPGLLDNVPLGSTVTITETQPKNSLRVRWAAPEIDRESVVLAAEHTDEPETVTVTNRAREVSAAELATTGVGLAGMLVAGLGLLAAGLWLLQRRRRRGVA